MMRIGVMLVAGVILFVAGVTVGTLWPARIDREAFQGNVWRWLLGLGGIAVLAGTIITYLWYAFLCWLLGIVRSVPVLPRRPMQQTGQLTGIIERVFFATAIATDMTGTAIAMIAWITAKNIILWPGFTKTGPSAQGYVSLMSSMGSMVVAIVAGVICRAKPV